MTDLRQLIEELRRARESATPLPWEPVNQGPSGWMAHKQRWSIDGNAMTGSGDPAVIAEEMKGKNARYITAADTDYIVAACNNSAALEDECERLMLELQAHIRTIGLLNSTMDSLRTSSGDIYRKQEADKAQLTRERDEARAEEQKTLRRLEASYQANRRLEREAKKLAEALREADEYLRDGVCANFIGTDSILHRKFRAALAEWEKERG